MIPKLSLCIPTYKRIDFLLKHIKEYLKNPYIDEIVISDETGEDIEKLKIEFPNESKLKMYSNYNNKLGPFSNKNKVVSYALNEWICLMDSDNFAPTSYYFEPWIRYIQQHGLEYKTVYMPVQTFIQPNHPGFDYISFKDIVFSKENIHLLEQDISVYSCLLNTGNYIFHRQNYLESNQYHYELQNQCDIQDVFFKNALLLLNGSKLKIVPEMRYHHIVHDGSFFTLNRENNYDQVFENVYQIYRKM